MDSEKPKIRTQKEKRKKRTQFPKMSIVCYSCATWHVIEGNNDGHYHCPKTTLDIAVVEGE